MANADRPRGAECYGKVLRSTKYIADAACYPGDFLEMTAAGKVQPASSATAAVLIGVCLSYASADGDEVSVADHPDQLFKVQSDDAAEPAAQTAIGLNYDLVITAGSSTYEISRQEIDGDTGVVTAATPLRLIAIDERNDNAFGGNADCIVRINMHRLTQVVGETGL